MNLFFIPNNRTKARYFRYLAILCVTLLWGETTLFAEASKVEGIRFWQSPTKTRVVFDMSSTPNHQLMTLANPHRIVIDINQGEVAVDLNQININSTLIERIRSSYSHETQNLRLVLDLKRQAKPNSFTLKPIQNVGNRLVVDLVENEAEAVAAKAIKRAADLKKNNILVVIDAGHGGEDPGAIGAMGTYEKNIALSISKMVADAINRQAGMKAVMSRTGDYYIGLRKRTEIARAKGADLFISVHADAFRDKRVRGASVWVLSDKGADSEVGRWLEQREKEADLLGGVESVALNNYEADVAEVLLKIQTEHSVRLSQSIAQNVIDELARTIVVHNNKTKSAGFIVLKNPAIPSILVETGFISNREDERNLRSRKYQQKVANSIVRGVHDYFRTNTPMGVKMANIDLVNSGPMTHRVSRGDTLSGIAHKYGVSMKQLRRTNNLKGDKLLVGKNLIIPI
jgi:N-acetylmuramoyl-L-alanine amidase